MKTYTSLIALLFFSLFGYSQYTAIPDPNFENALSAYDDIPNDGQVPTVSISGLTSLNVSNQNISDLTGIQDFTALQTLYCHNNQINNLDVTQNTALQILRCYNNQLTALDVTQNTALKNLSCGSNQLFNLDVTQNTALQTLICYNCQLTNLDVTQNTVLKYLYCYSNQLTNLDVTQNTDLQILNCYNNQINDLDLSSNTSLTEVRCHNNNMTSLNVKNGNNTNVTTFQSDNNPNLLCIEVDDVTYSSTNWTNIDSVSNFSTNCYFGETYVPDDNFEYYLETHNANLSVVPLGDPTSMGNGTMDDYVTTSHIDTVIGLYVQNLNIADMTGIEDFVQLTYLHCYQNQITSLDVSNNVLLTQLLCNINQISSLDLSQNTVLQSLWCFGNQLTALDLSQNINMVQLLCDNNQISDLDLSVNTTLTQLRCHNNNMTSLNVKNGNNTNFTTFQSDNNPNLLCIKVDDVAYSTANWTQIDAASTFSTYCPLGETYVPDDNFETYLETHDANGTVVVLGDPTSMGNGIMDDYVITTNINMVTSLNISNLNIVNMTGIEDFTALQTLYCHNNQINNLDVTQNTALQILRCYNNQLTALDVTQNTALKNLSCGSNQLFNLDVTQNTALQTLICYNSQLTNLDVTQNTVLKYLYCYSNQLTNLDVSQNTDLQILNCYNNQINDLDLSSNTSLTEVRCHNNNMTSLNVKNGNNTNVTTFQSDNNPNLLCIEVDDAAYSTANWTQIDASSSFSTHCPLGETYVPDNNFEAYLETHDANGVVVPLGDPTSMGNGIANDDYVTTSRIDTVQTLVVASLGISDMTGIEDFIALTFLDCRSNQINTLNLNNNTLLTTLVCHVNNLTSLDVSTNLQLTGLDCHTNQLTSLDVSLNTNLTWFNCRINQLTNLNLANGNNTNFTFYDSRFNSNLTCINVDNPVYSTTNWTNVDAWSTFSNNCPSTCSYPTNLSASTPTFSGATLAWQENGFATVWDLEIGTQGFIPTGTATQENVSNPYVWTGGTPNTTYDFYVRADCSGNNTITSAWEGPFTFSTITFCESGDFTLDNTTLFNGVMKSAIAFADIDGDNDQDILITGVTTTNQEIAELYTNNAGIFTLVAGTPFTGVSDSSVAFADVDNDGDQDVVITGVNTGNQVINLYLNNGSGVFTLDVLNTFALNSFASLAFADVDANGFQDLVITGYGGTSLYKNTGGTFTLDATTNFQALGKSATDFADVDGDGDPDLLISGDNAGYHTKLYINNGAGVFTLSAQAFQGVFRGDNEFADIDNDGDQDVLITGYGISGTFYSNLYSNDGSGNFTLIATPFDPMFASSVAFGDIDSDGDKDLIMSGLTIASGRTTKLYNNNGTGTFTEVLGTPFDGTDSGSLAFADIDNDFDLDVLITGQNVASTRIAKLYLNNTYYNTNYTTTGWTNGIPDINKCAVIDDDLSVTNFSARKLTVNATLTVTANSYIQIKKDIINNVMLRVEPTGSVVQIDDTSTVTGAGDFQTQIQTTPLQDNTRYTYFSSPSASETVNTFSSWANTGSMWSYDETNQAWVHITNTSTPMNPADGYIIRGNSSISYPTSPITEFANAYNNGIITQSLNFKGDGGAALNIDNDSNLVGNPYPSAIDGTKLLNAALNPTAGTLYFWTHNSSPVSGNFSADDYALWNLSGGTAAISGGTAPTGFIASGQGFFIDAEGDETLALGTNVASTLTFNNEMRVISNNTDFRRPASATENKIWLDLTNAQGVFNQALIAFLPNATNQFDRAYDGKRTSNGIATIYSIEQDGQQLGIQALPTLQDDTVVPLGYTVENTTINQLKIGINHTENMQGFTVYLKDTVLNTIHNLSDSDYNFTVTTTGVFNHRFELLFRTSALSETDYTLNENLIVSNQNDTILVKTANGSIINKLEVYNLLGKQILKTKLQNSTYSIDAKNINQGTILFVKATLENGTVLNKKIIKL